MKDKIDQNDFKDKGGYLSFNGKNCEICIEPCFNGADIAVYDLKQNILEPKYCTNIQTIPTPTAEMMIGFWKDVNAKVNEFYKRHELKGGDEA